tara:strand:- start:1275 stop:1601 length:327 start_codon:yes stop_codon:yes gene_type:complete
MTQKKLQAKSKYNDLDINNDSIVSDAELEMAEKLTRLENNDKKDDQIRIMAMISLVSVIGLVLLALSPIIPDSRIELCTALISTYIVTNLGILATFMATNAWSKKNGS